MIGTSGLKIHRRLYGGMRGRHHLCLLRIGVGGPRDLGVLVGMIGNEKGSVIGREIVEGGGVGHLKEGGRGGVGHLLLGGKEERRKGIGLGHHHLGLRMGKRGA